MIKGEIIMTLVPNRVKCTKCGKRFFWNPDVGKGNCPRCGRRWKSMNISKVHMSKELRKKFKAIPKVVS